MEREHFHSVGIIQFLVRMKCETRRVATVKSMSLFSLLLSTPRVSLCRGHYAKRRDKLLRHASTKLTSAPLEKTEERDRRKKKKRRKEGSAYPQFYPNHFETRVLSAMILIYKNVASRGEREQKSDHSRKKNTTNACDFAA